MKRLFLIITIILTSVVYASPARVQEAYPTKPIRWVVPHPPGVPVDTWARKIASVAAEILGTTIVIENKPGAGATIGAAEVAKARPDGYTFLIAVNDPLVSQTALMKSLPYDPGKDFVFITKLVQSDPVLYANASLVQANDIGQLVSEAKRMQGGMPYASFGVGSFSHIIMEALGKVSGAPFVHVPYRGSPQAIQELVAGQVSLSFGGLVAEPFVATGRLKRVGVIAEKRNFRKELPTFAEAGFTHKIFSTPLWTGLLAPAQTPEPFTERMRSAVVAALSRPDVIEFFRSGGSEPVAGSAEEFRREWQREYDSIPPLIRQLGISSE